MTNIYIITNTVNNKVYVGQTRRDVHIRFLEHMRDPESGLYPDACKYGRDCFTYSILHICDNRYADQWEHYYICKYNSTDSSLGYNRVADRAFRWKSGKFNPSKTCEGKKRISDFNRDHKELITAGFVRYNNSRKFPVGMLDDTGNIIKRFDSLLDACKYLNKPSCGTTRIKQVCDKFRRNGKRYKFYGYSWTALNENVQTNSYDECRVEDELPLE